MRYVVMGADGQLGGRVASNMLDAVSGRELIFTSPDPSRIPVETLEDWKSKGVTIAAASYDDRAGMKDVFAGAERVWMVSGVYIGLPRQLQHRNVIDAAVDAGIEHLTYTSSFGANRQGYGQYVIPDHTFTEAYIGNSGLSFNIMRNNLYLENYFLDGVKMALRCDNKWTTTAGEHPATFVAKDDSGRVGAALLLGKGELNTAYDVCGLPITERKIVEMIAAASGIPLEYRPVDAETFYAHLDKLGVPRTSEGDSSKSPVLWCSDDMVSNEAAVGLGQMAVETDTIERLTGRKPTDPATLVEKYSHFWREWAKS
ncbi:NmrA family NAD(P)-binding protein [Pectobacterium sp. B2J-2]|uniref:NmrA family NAD(P)-binding protein n=1 Tax=Pectobacterium sp. B2J-2 TaxID=3385372 RepID=UPI0038FC7FD8